MEIIAVLDFGGQYTHLIMRRVRDFGVYSQMFSHDTDIDEIERKFVVKGIILSGGGYSVFSNKSPTINTKLFKKKIPILGICYGHQAISFSLGGEVKRSRVGEYGLTQVTINKNQLFEGIDIVENVWMNHEDIVLEPPQGYEIIAKSSNCPVVGIYNKQQNIYGIQFHPEVSHTQCGKKIFSNFLFNIVQIKKNWSTKQVISHIRREIRESLKETSIIGLSGGIDSSVAAVLTHQEIGDKLVSVYVDTGLMRYKEEEFIKKNFQQFGFTPKIVNAKKIFFQKLKNVTNPERKRKIIGKQFIEIFQAEAQRIDAHVLIQGTIYSDRIESGSTVLSSNIKSHHNVGGLPKNLNIKIYEPLRELYKDEVRAIAFELGFPQEFMTRHVFPGPGLAIRIIGNITAKKVSIVRTVQSIIEEELKEHNLYDKVWMAFPVLLPIKSVGIQGDKRSYKYPIVLRIVESKDAMTANFAKIPYSVLENISLKIVNNVREINRVAYDITNKPPATMEWE